MTAKEAIQTIEAAKAEVEWNYPLNYAAAFEKAIEALEKQIPKKPIINKRKIQCVNGHNAEFCCGNEESDYYSIPTAYDDTCDDWEGKE